MFKFETYAKMTAINNDTNLIKQLSELGGGGGASKVLNNLKTTLSS